MKIQPKWFSQFVDFLSRISPNWIVAIGVLLVLPSINTGIVADDHYHHIVIQEMDVPGVTNDGNIFAFATGNEEQLQQAQDIGIFPWWAQSDLKLAFYRPLSAFTHVLDERFWPNQIWIYHLHSIFWYGALLFALSVFYKRLSQEESGIIATLALFLYAIDDAHGSVVGWIANRNATIAVTLGIIVLILHDRAQKNPTKIGQNIAPYFMLIFALLAGESAIAVGGYLFAYAVFLDKNTILQRTIRLLPYLIIVVFWRILYHYVGAGTHGSALYIDPASDPITFLGAAISRVPILLSASIGGLWSDFWPMYPKSIQPFIVLFSLFLLILFGWFVWPALKKSQNARFFALGSFLASVPIAATVPADRLLLFVTVGTAGLLASAIIIRTQKQRFVVFATTTLLIVHIVFSAPLLAVRSRSMQTISDFVALSDESWPSNIDGKTVIFVNPPMDPSIGYAQLARFAQERSTAEHTHWLTTGNTEIIVSRIDEKTLVLTQENGMLSSPTEQLLRINPFFVGERISLSGFEVEIEAITEDGRPLQVRYTFKQPLENQIYVFMVWEDHGFIPYDPPMIGEFDVIQGVDIVSLLLGG